MLKILFHTYNLVFIILYIYPGSILGYLFYKDIYKQPQLPPDLSIISLNHFYPFLTLSILGLLSFKKKKFFIMYSFCLSIILELFHILIPNRLFQFPDLFGNITGVITPIFLIMIYNIWQKK